LGIICHSPAQRQEAEGWGKNIVEQLASDLRLSYAGVRGFSASSLWRMRLFYREYGSNEKLAPMVREIGWSHNPELIATLLDKI